MEMYWNEIYPLSIQTVHLEKAVKWIRRIVDNVTSRSNSNAPHLYKNINDSSQSYRLHSLLIILAGKIEKGLTRRLKYLFSL